MPLKARGNVSGFGLGVKLPVETDKPSSKRALDFGEEELTRKKLAKLPAPPLEDASQNDANGTVDGIGEEEEDEDDYVDMQDGGTEEENAAAARAAAEKREERLQNQNLGLQAQIQSQHEVLGSTGPDGDLDMIGGIEDPAGISNAAEGPGDRGP